jgi:aspartyl-tRNA(Asn)/glutamyl-tRNA(Gln) amidotransferase subunit A
MDLTSLTLSEAAAMISRGELSSVELTGAHLQRIEALNPSLNCFITVTPEIALQQASEAEEAILHGGYRGPLHGIPIALKDLYETRGVRTTAGSKFFADCVPTEDGFVVQKLNEAGTVSLGKLNMHEIALGVTSNNPHYGACRNPWDEQRIPGGSSGGSGAALAAGLCMASMGSDTGGSIRIPASLCGVVGFKPTYGRVSLRGVIPLSWSLDHAGPMARCVKDVALLLQAVAGYDAADPASLDVPVDNYTSLLEAGVRGWRVALAEDEYFRTADASVLEAVQSAARVFVAAGAQVEQVEVPDARQAAQANLLTILSEAAAFHKERLESRMEDFGADISQRLQLGAAASPTDIALARRAQAEVRRRFELFFSGYDILLTPTTPIPAPFIEGQDAIEQALRLTRFTAPFNLTGLPALSVPCGFTGEGLPVGLQIVSRPWGEAKVLRAGYAYQQDTDWHRRRPSL